MKESFPNPAESSAERVPTSEEVYSVLQELTEKEYIAVRKLEDEKGVYLLEVTVLGEEDGETVEYSYMRKGIHSKKMQSSQSAIHVTYYKDGFPISGTSAARFVDGVWETLK
ncbi:MAG: hypothetical protein G01um101419_87 [Parcubacteria group bacterium Gr01-1014_19]|nr:MAG: hypothetical protein G01um101419_87 [Parcubacteria group bacterium Gr01-1014_19]